MKTRLAFGMSMAMSVDCYLVGDERVRKKAQAAFGDHVRSAPMIMFWHAHCEAWYFDDIEARVAERHSGDVAPVLRPA